MPLSSISSSDAGSKPRMKIKLPFSLTIQFIIRSSKLHSYFIAFVFTSLNRWTHKTIFLISLRPVKRDRPP